MAESTYFLPFLWGSHESSKFLSVEPPHGKVVERKVCTEREADIQAIMEVEELHFPIYLYTLFMQKGSSSMESRWFVPLFKMLLVIILMYFVFQYFTPKYY